MYWLTTQDLCLWEPPPLDTKTTAYSRYNVIGRSRIILISIGELLTISYFGRSTYILISDIISITISDLTILTVLYRTLLYRTFLYMAVNAAVFLLVVRVRDQVASYSRSLHPPFSASVVTTLRYLGVV